MGSKNEPNCPSKGFAREACDVRAISTRERRSSESANFREGAAGSRHHRPLLCRAASVSGALGCTSVLEMMAAFPEKLHSGPLPAAVEGLPLFPEDRWLVVQCGPHWPHPGMLCSGIRCRWPRVGPGTLWRVLGFA